MPGPIHLQDNFSKAPLAGREQNIQQASADLAQRQASQTLNQEHILDQSRTRPAAQSDAAENRVDDREERRGQGRGGSGQQRHGGGDEDQGEAGAEAGTDEHRIDVVA